MTFVNCGTLGVKSGQREKLVEHLTQFSPDLKDAGCMLYEVGVNEDEPDKVFVVELWSSAKAHQDSLQLDSVKSAIADAMPMLTGDFGGFRFEVVGSPLPAPE